MDYQLLVACLLIFAVIPYCYGQVKETECVCLQDMVEQDEIFGVVRMVPFPDGSGRMLMAELGNVIWLYYPNFTREPVPFASFPIDAVYYIVGLAIHPSFPDDGRIFVNFNRFEDGDAFVTLRQYNTDTGNPNIIDVESEVILIDKSRKPEGTNIHMGGEVFFGLDGYLYTSFGDGTLGDPLYAAQNRSDFRGKVLRLDVNNATDDQPYSIPPDNPYINDEDTLPEIFALGFRQPWAISVDKGDPDTGDGRGRMFVSDCGEKSYEEVSLLKSGGNYGWSSREGNACYKYRYCGQIGPEEFPIATYRHEYIEGEAEERCIIGASVYRGGLNPGLTGWYIHGDSGLRRLFKLKQNETGEWMHHVLPFCDTETCDELGMADNLWNSTLLSFGLDGNGEIYVSTAFSGTEGAEIQRIVDPATYNPEFQQVFLNN